MPRKKKSFIERNQRTLVILAIALIFANAAVYAFTHFEGPTTYADDPVYLNLAGMVLDGTFQMTPGNIFSVRLMQFVPIAVSWALFGINNLTSSLWDISSYLGMVVVIFLIVRLMYSDRAALLSAFLLSIFPLVTWFAVNTSEDIPLTFIGALSIYMFLRAEKGNSKWHFFASGALLVVTWLISYEAGIIIAFVLLYALIELLRKKLSINRKSMYFMYGVIAAFLIVFAYSAATINMPFAVITINSRFYSAVGASVNGGPTIPSANTDLSYYPGLMFQYRLLDVLLSSPPQNMLQNVYAAIFPANPTYEYGLYFYLLVPVAILLVLIKERRSYFFMLWAATMLLLLEFGPMHIGMSIIPFKITYVLTHRLERFILPATPAVAAIIGIGFDKLLSVKKRSTLFAGAAIVAFLLVCLYMSNFYISEFHYWWVRYPQMLAMQPADFLRHNPAVNSSTMIYLDGFINGTQLVISYSGAAFPFYIGRPAGQNMSLVSGTDNCSEFSAQSYVVWSGPAHCSNWVDVFNSTTPKGVPAYFISTETQSLINIPTNVYYVT